MGFGSLGARFGRLGVDFGTVGQRSGAPHIILSALSIDENSANGTELATASIIGAYTGTPEWSVPEDASGTWEIDPDTGVITVLDNTALDFETNPTLPITVSVTGVTPAVADCSKNIRINNVSEGGDGPSLDFSDPENSQYIPLIVPGL